MKFPKSKQRVHKGWLLHRFNSLPENATTYDVHTKLGISDIYLRKWLADPYFRQNEVAQKVEGRWVWNRERLLVWVIAAMRLKVTLSEKAPTIAEAIPLDELTPVGFTMAANPPEITEVPTPEEARDILGMPTDYSPRLGRDRIPLEEALRRAHESRKRHAESDRELESDAGAEPEDA